MYTKETISSLAIERERPNASRAEKFANLLKRVAEIATLDEETLTALQSSVVDPRFAEPGFRNVQNYVGESVGLHRQMVHYVPPRPEDVEDLMQGWREALEDAPPEIDGVVWAACLAFGFVYVHPFQDGNGRLHRFIIHYALARHGVTPPGVIAPVSAVMLARRREYDACLESFSKHLMPLIDYEPDEQQAVRVLGESAHHYRYIDYSSAAEYLYEWLASAGKQSGYRETVTVDASPVLGVKVLGAWGIEFDDGLGVGVCGPASFRRGGGRWGERDARLCEGAAR